MITYFKDRNHKSVKKFKKYKILTTILKSFDIFGIIVTTTTSSTLSLTGFGLIVIPIPTGIASRLTIISKVKFEIVMPKNNKHKKKQDERKRQTIQAFNKFYKNV